MHTCCASCCAAASMNRMCVCECIINTPPIRASGAAARCFMKKCKASSLEKSLRGILESGYTVGILNSSFATFREAYTCQTQDLPIWGPSHGSLTVRLDGQKQHPGSLRTFSHICGSRERPQKPTVRNMIHRMASKLKTSSIVNLPETQNNSCIEVLHHANK